MSNNGCPSPSFSISSSNQSNRSHLISSLISEFNLQNEDSMLHQEQFRNYLRKFFPLNNSNDIDSLVESLYSSSNDSNSSNKNNLNKSISLNLLVDKYLKIENHFENEKKNILCKDYLIHFTSLYFNILFKTNSFKRVKFEIYNQDTNNNKFYVLNGAFNENYKGENINKTEHFYIKERNIENILFIVFTLITSDEKNNYEFTYNNYLSKLKESLNDDNENIIGFNNKCITIEYKYKIIKIPAKNKMNEIESRLNLLQSLYKNDIKEISDFNLLSNHNKIFTNDNNFHTPLPSENYINNKNQKNDNFLENDISVEIVLNFISSNAKIKRIEGIIKEIEMNNKIKELVDKIGLKDHKYNFINPYKCSKKFNNITEDNSRIPIFLTDTLQQINFNPKCEKIILDIFC